MNNFYEALFLCPSQFWSFYVDTYINFVGNFILLLFLRNKQERDKKYYLGRFVIWYS